MVKKKIIIADDFENTRWVVEFTLRSLDCDILKATNGKEALAFFNGQNIDLLITDLNMPVMDGLELIRNVKTKQHYRSLPVILLTTEKKTELKKQAMDLNITTWIQKPFKTEDFLKVVNKCLQIT